MNRGIWEETVRKNADQKSMGPYDRSKGGICAKKGESISVVKRRKKEDERVYSGAAEEGIYPTVKVTTNSTNILCRKERQKEMDGIRLQIFE